MLFKQKIPTKDLERRDPNQPRISIFFELLKRKFVNLMKVNILYLLGAIPTIAITMFVMSMFVNPVMNGMTDTIAKVLGLAAADFTNQDFARYYVMIDAGLRIVLTLGFMIFLGMGPVSAGFNYIMRNYAREDYAWILSDLFDHSKRNFGQALAVFVIDLCAFCLMLYAFVFYINQPGIMQILGYAVFGTGLVFAMMHLYIYPMMVTFKLTVKQIYKNAFFLAFAEAPKNLLLILIMAFFHLALPSIMIYFGWAVGWLLLFIIAELVFAIAATGFMTNFFIYPTIEKYINEAEEKASSDINQ